MGADRVAVRGVIFDMDGVLCDSEPFICEAACRMFAEKGVGVSPEDFVPFVGAGENRYLGGVAQKHGLTLDMPRDKARTYEIYLELIKGRLKPISGAREFVLLCRRRGLKTALATSADSVKMFGNLRELGLEPRATSASRSASRPAPGDSVEPFDALVTGNDVTRKKPDPDIFLLAAERLGLPPSACLVAEDAPNGVQAARAAGSPCLALTTSFSAVALRQAGADWTAPDLSHVPDQVLART